MDGSGSMILQEHFYHDEGSQLVFHVLEYAGCAPFSRELTRGWGQAVELLGSVGQIPGMTGWSVQPWLPDIVVLDGQSCHIYSTSWEGFHKLCLAKRFQFSHT